MWEAFRRTCNPGSPARRLFTSTRASTSAQQVRFFIAYDHDVRSKKYKNDWIPAGYYTFTKAFNKEDFSEKFAYFDTKHKDDHDKPDAPLLYEDAPSPTISLLGIEPWECFVVGRCVRPGYVEITEVEYNNLL